ncbi:uncharacterized protein [Antedon mediterranea]|uniref:uncharacterized protein n=1 Tax=Antedon mediterranea TaxID=105859 RepID=UPI003AF7BE4A
MDEKPVTSRKFSSSGDKGKKTKKRKKPKSKDSTKRRPSGKSSVGTPEGETNSDSAIDAVRRKLPKSENAKNGTKPRKSKERKSSITKSKSPQVARNRKGLCIGKAITLRAISGSLNLTTTGDLINNGSLIPARGILPSPNYDSVSSPKGVVCADTSPKSPFVNLTLNYTSKQQDKDSTSSSSDSDISDVVVKINESLRWENELSDEEKEKYRIQTYKLNRRKRYLVDSMKKRQDKEGILQFARELSLSDNYYR